MKRIGTLLCLSALIVLFSTTFCFAGSLSVTTYPENGQKNTSIENLGAKLFFSDSMNDKATIKANENSFKILDKDGKEIPIKIYYHSKEKGMVLVLADVTNSKLKVTGNTTYTLWIAGDVIDDNGDILGEDKTVEFTTVNQARNSQINMLMMVIMFAGIFIFSTKAMKKKTQKQEEEIRDDKVNPYKESKKTGKTVQEIVEKDKKEKAKKAAKAQRKAARAAGEIVEYDKELDEGIYKVKAPKPISLGGSSYATGRKAIAEEKAQEEARRAKKIAQSKSKAKKKNK